MKQEQIFQQVTDTILELLEKAQSREWQQQWVNIGAGEPKNAISKKNYRGFNYFYLSVMCMLKGYNKNQWLTIKQANEAGAKIRKGEKSTIVGLYKKTFFDKDGKKYFPDQVTAEMIRDLKLTSKTYLTEYHVFNVAQVEGLPSEMYLIPSFTPLTDFEKNEKAEMLLNASGAKIVYKNGLGAYYNFASDSITLPEREMFRGEEPFYSVAFHELAHWTGHKTRLDRIREQHSGHDYGIEELVAELCTAFICGALGIESQITNNANYLKGWISALKADNKIIFKVTAEAQKAADFILKPIHNEVAQAA